MHSNISKFPVISKIYRTPGIYYIKNTKKQAAYIGWSTSVGRRISQHITYLNLNKHKNSELQKDWNIDDKDWEVGVLIYGDIDSTLLLAKIEASLIRSLKNKLYNVNVVGTDIKLNVKQIARFRACQKLDDSGCILWTGKKHHRDGYGTFAWGQDGKKLKINAHRIAFYLKYRFLPDGLLVRHICHNKLCVNPDHLILGTDFENSNDGYDNHGRPPTIDIEEVRRLVNDGVKSKDIAKQMKVNPASIYYAIKKHKMRPIRKYTR